MSTKSRILPKTTDNHSKGITIRTVLNIYGVFLFLGLIISIFTHEIEDVSGFSFFIAISSVLYFLLLNLYFISDLGRKVVYITVAAIGLFSVFMAFYLQINPMDH